MATRLVPLFAIVFAAAAYVLDHDVPAHRFSQWEIALLLQGVAVGLLCAAAAKLWDGD